MKTNFYTLTLLAVSIQVTVSGQTQGNQSSHRILNTLGEKPKTTISTNAPEVQQTAQNVTPFSPANNIVVTEKKTEQKTTVQKNNATANTVTDKEKKLYPTIVSSSEPETKTQLATNTTNNSQPVKIDNNTFNYYNNTNCYTTMVYASELLKQAEELNSIEQVLRTSSKTKVGEEKNRLVKSANELRSQSELKQIQASEITGKVNLETFNNNKVIFIVLIKKVNSNEAVIIEEAKIINNEAEHNMKLAKEMREEAYSMPSNAAKLGAMSNAEEKESIALNKQDQAITLVKKYTAGNTPKRTNDLVMK